MKKICFVSTFFGTAEKFLYEHIMTLSKDYDITIICDFIDSDYSELEKLPIKYKKISIPRKISIIKDIKSFWELYKFFKKEKFWAIHSLSHKPGLVTPIAAILTHCKIRIYTFTGQYWANKNGAARFILKLFDWLIAHLNNHIMIDGNSQRQFLIDEHIISEKKSIVLGNGSICGVNMKKFSFSQSIKIELRDKLKISKEKVVYIYLGRLCKDKGITELIESFNNICIKCKNAFLLFVGWDEDNYLEKIKKYPNIKEGINYTYYGSTKEPEKIYQIGDIACIPSYREGFGMCVIEASALKLPVICSDVYGIKDSYINNVTGLQCKVRDTQSLEECMIKLYNDPTLRIQLGENGEKMVIEKYNCKFVTKCWVDYYHSLK